jgi:hypothetical protein
MTPAVRVAKYAAVLLIPVANLPPVLLMLVVHLDLQISLRIFGKFEMTLMSFLGLGRR